MTFTLKGASLGDLRLAFFSEALLRVPTDQNNSHHFISAVILFSSYSNAQSFGELTFSLLILNAKFQQEFSLF